LDQLVLLCDKLALLQTTALHWREHGHTGRDAESTAGIVTPHFSSFEFAVDIACGAVSEVSEHDTLGARCVPMMILHLWSLK
jgi:hypothetical protein